MRFKWTPNTSTKLNTTLQPCPTSRWASRTITTPTIGSRSTKEKKTNMSSSTPSSTQVFWTMVGHHPRHNPSLHLHPDNQFLHHGKHRRREKVKKAPSWPPQQSFGGRSAGQPHSDHHRELIHKHSMLHYSLPLNEDLCSIRLLR